mgnify:CR=1 FL=1
MSKARLVILSVVVEGRSQADTARIYGVSPSWVSKLVGRWRQEGIGKSKVPPYIRECENKMKCGIGHCGRCYVGPFSVCRAGPVVTWAELNQLPKDY